MTISLAHPSAILLAVCSLLISSVTSANPVRPLAQDHVTVYESPNPKNVPLYNPSIISLDSGRLVAAYLVSGKRDPKLHSRTDIVTSDDGGLTWQKRAESKIGQSRLFQVGHDLYLIGTSMGLNIQRSTDDGLTWSKPTKIATGRWHQSATNYWLANGNVYLALEKRVGEEINGWYVGELSPILLRAKVTDDLTKPESWSFSPDYTFKDIIPGYTENYPIIEFVGIPFYAQDFPERNVFEKGYNMPPMGWLEANVAQITDPDHYWYDPKGKTFHLLMRAHTGGTGYAAMAKVVENEDGIMTTSLETVPSGQSVLYLPMPGGQMRFHILYDEETKLYWLLSSQATDSMTRAERLPPERYNLPNNERHRLVLYFSKNLVDWCFAGVVAIGNSPKEARHYASMAIDGEDIVILSRSGDERARSAHDGNLITFHRVKDFRDLVY